jgi:hypothetical protein
MHKRTLAVRSNLETKIIFFPRFFFINMPQVYIFFKTFQFLPQELVLGYILSMPTNFHTPASKITQAGTILRLIRAHVTENVQ